MNDLLNWWLTGIILVILQLEYTKTAYNKKSILDWFTVIVFGLFWPLLLFDNIHKTN